MRQTCICGVTLRTIEVDGRIKLYCPRCNVVSDQVEETKKYAANENSGYSCEVCGTSMPCACRAVCPNCGWQKSCE